MDNQECLDWILDNLTYRLEKVDGKHGEQWCYPESDYSGRDFYKNIPIQHLSDDLMDTLLEEVWSDFDYEFEPDDDFMDWDTFEDLFNQVFDQLVDENLGEY